MLAYLKIYAVMLVAFVALDAVWLGLIARTFYSKHLGYLLADKPIWAAAGVFYLLFVLGLLVLVVLPGIEAGSVKRVVLLGLVYGLVTYGTYDLTNLALVKDWPWIVTVVDLCWGAGLSIALGWIGFVAGRMMMR